MAVSHSIVPGSAYRNQLRPGYSVGYARGPEESIAPQQWRGLVGAWCANLGHTGDQVRDVSGHGHHGVLGGTANLTPTELWATNGDLGTGWTFNFPSVSPTHAIEVNPFPLITDKTFTVWVRNDNSSSFNTLLAFGADSPFFGTNIARVTIFGNVVGATTMTDGVWYHVAGTSGPDGSAVYVNGQLDATGTRNTQTDSFLRIGWEPTALQLVGHMDDIRVYDRALSAAQIREIYELGPGGMFILRPRRFFLAQPSAPEPPIISGAQMGFHEVQFPTKISYGSVFGPGHSTDIVVLRSGAEERNAQWAQARRKYDAGVGVSTIPEMYTVYEFNLARSGSAFGFRWKDWLDHASTSDGRTLAGKGAADPAFDDVEIGVGDNFTQTFQLVKKYVSGPATKTRVIQKPVAGTVKVGLGGVEQVSGFSVNTVTGEVVFTVAPTSAENITAGFEFDVPARFTKDADDWMPISIDSFEAGSISIPVIELLDERPAFEDFNYGGAKTIDPMQNSVNITPAEAMYWRLNPTVGNLSIFLAEPAGLGTGGPYFYLEHIGPANAFDVRDDTGTFMVQMSPQVPRAWVMLAQVGSAKVWVLIPG